MCAELETVRAKGYALCDEELDPGIYSYACPVYLEGVGVWPGRSDRTAAPLRAGRNHCQPASGGRRNRRPAVAPLTMARETRLPIQSKSRQDKRNRNRNSYASQYTAL